MTPLKKLEGIIVADYGSRAYSIIVKSARYSLISHCSESVEYPVEDILDAIQVEVDSQVLKDIRILVMTRVNILLREISKETSILSYHIEDHPKLLEIIAIGDDAVPHLLGHLRESRDAEIAKFDGYDFYDYAPWYAIIALSKITGANPIKQENAGRLFGIIEDWLSWSDL